MKTTPISEVEGPLSLDQKIEEKLLHPTVQMKRLPLHPLI